MNQLVGFFFRNFCFHSREGDLKWFVGWGGGGKGAEKGKGADCELQLGIEAQYVGALLKLFFSSLPSTVYKTASFQLAQVAIFCENFSFRT